MPVPPPGAAPVSHELEHLPHSQEWPVMRPSSSVVASARHAARSAVEPEHSQVARVHLSPFLQSV
ncbi:MAG: hypothetical protein AAF628_06105 [Planctomycetota bacterium]